MPALTTAADKVPTLHAHGPMTLAFFSPVLPSRAPERLERPPRPILA
jgi:hypothetical protein